MERPIEASEHARRVEIVEIYVPAQLRYLSRLYDWLANELETRRSRALFHGFSLYEVDGAFRGRRKVYQEKTRVVRLTFDLPEGEPAESVESRSYEARISAIADAVVEITGGAEEEVWILRTPARKTVRYARR